MALTLPPPSFRAHHDLPPNAPDPPAASCSVFSLRKHQRPPSAPLCPPDAMPLSSFSSLVSAKLTRKRILSLKSASHQVKSIGGASPSPSASPATASSSSSPSGPRPSSSRSSQDEEEPEAGERTNTEPNIGRPQLGQWAEWPTGSLIMKCAPRTLPPPPECDVKTRPPDRGRSLDLSPYGSTNVEGTAGPSQSTESVLVFFHPARSESSVSLPLSHNSSPDPVRSQYSVAGASTKSQPTAAAGGRKRRKRRDYTPPYPYFVTPLALTSVNPHLAVVPIIVAPEPKGKGKERASEGEAHHAASRTDLASDSPQADRSHLEAHSTAVSWPKFRLRRITSRGKLLRKSAPDGGHTSPTIQSPIGGSRPPDHLAPSQTSSPVELSSSPKMADTARTRSPRAPSDASHAEAAPDPPSDGDERLEVSVATLKMRTEIREETGLEHVVHQLRMLRAPAKMKF